MPAEDLTLVPVFMPDPKRYSVDVSASPVNGGNVSIVDTPTFPGQMWQRLYQNGFTNVAATVPLTLTANPAGGRSFVRWLNGPCANSTEPVCSFVMPSSPVTSNPLFGDEPDSACAYAVSAPSFAFPGVGGSRIVTITTQAGCGFNTAVFDNQRVGDIVATTTGNTVTLSVPAFTPNYGRTGVLRIHTGREVFSLPFMQAGNSSDSQTNAATVDFGTVGVADVGTVTRTVAFTNSTASALTVSSIVTRGSFAIRSSTCSASLAIGASCNVLVEFVPRKAGTMLGELLIGSKGHTFAAPLIGTATATRENVAAATAGATVSATTQLNPVDYPVLALIDGDRRMTPPNQTPWVSSRDLVNPQYIEVKFVSARTIEWLYLIGGYRNSAEFAEPSSISTELSTTLTGFTIQYWTGTSWTAVSELSRVDGTNAWRRISFTPVTTDRVRLVLPTLAVGQQFVASELEVWTVASDTTPNAFAFAPASSVALSTAVQSGAITPIGFNAAAPISVSGGSYSIGCNGVFTTTAGTLQPGQSVCVRHTSAASGASTVTTTLTIGGVAGTFSSTTQTVIVPPSDVTPDAIASQTIIDVAVTSTIYFAPFSVTGINAPATLTIGGTAGLEVSVGCTAAFSTTPTTVTNGQSICVRHVSANAALTNAVSTLTIGTVTVTFTSRTVAAALTCSFDFTGNGSVASDDALIFTRWLLGIRGDALISGITPYPAGTSPAQFAVSVANRMSIGLAHDLDGNGTVDALTDGLLLLRMSQGLMGTAVTANALGIGAVRGTHSLIGSYANTSCGTSFLLPAPPTVTSVSPLTGAKDTWTVVRVVGTDLPATVSLVVDGQNINPCNTSRPSSVTSIDFWCPLRVIGAHTARVIVAYVAPAQQQQIGSTQSFIVYAPNIAITSFSPISRAGQFAFTVVGVDMPGTLGADIGGVNCGVSRVALATDGAFNCNVSTLPSGYHTVTIRDTSNGAILRQFTGAQGFLVP